MMTLSPCADMDCDHVVEDERAPYGVVFVCPQCGKRSTHPGDIRAGWCGNCSAFVTDPHPFEADRVWRDG